MVTARKVEGTGRRMAVFGRVERTEKNREAAERRILIQRSLKGMEVARGRVVVIGTRTSR